MIWNITRRCNLEFWHCYSTSSDHDFPGEFTSEQAVTALDDLAAFRITALILSGGEPLSRPDCLDLARRATTRFPTPFAIHGGPKFSANGRFAFIMNRDGWCRNTTCGRFRRSAAPAPGSIAVTSQHRATAGGLQSRTIFPAR